MMDAVINPCFSKDSCLPRKPIRQSPPAQSGEGWDDIVMQAIERIRERARYQSLANNTATQSKRYPVEETGAWQDAEAITNRIATLTSDVNRLHDLADARLKAIGEDEAKIATLTKGLDEARAECERLSGRWVAETRENERQMKFWFDTEFYEDGRTIELISIGVVAEDGGTYYAETISAQQLCRKSDWLVANVLPHLRGGDGKQQSQIACDLIEFMDEKPEIWAYYADYDWVVLCQLFGRMIDLPKGWPMYCRDVKQLCDSLGNPKLPEQPGTEHDALEDAIWTREAWQFLCKTKDTPP